MAASSVQAATNTVPLSGVYQEQSAAAHSAYDKAKARLQSDRLGIYNQYGFNPTGDNLDPYSTTGLMQRTMRQQAEELNAAEENALSRGLKGGLANQIAEAPRADQADQLVDLTHGYQQDLANNSDQLVSAEQQMQAAILAARQAQIQQAQAAGMWDPEGAANGFSGMAGNPNAGSIDGVDLNDFMYGTKVPGYSDEELYNAAKSNLPMAGALPMHIMHNGEVTMGRDPSTGKMVPGVYVKFNQADGKNTVWIPLPQSAGSQSAPAPTTAGTRQQSTSPAPTTQRLNTVRTALAKTTASKIKPKPKPKK